MRSTHPTPNGIEAKLISNLCQTKVPLAALTSTAAERLVDHEDRLRRCNSCNSARFHYMQCARYYVASLLFDDLEKKDCKTIDAGELFSTLENEGRTPTWSANCAFLGLLEGVSGARRCVADVLQSQLTKEALPSFVAQIKGYETVDACLPPEHDDVNRLHRFLSLELAERSWQTRVNLLKLHLPGLEFVPYREYERLLQEYYYPHDHYAPQLSADRDTTLAVLSECGQIAWKLWLLDERGTFSRDENDAKIFQHPINEPYSDVQNLTVIKEYLDKWKYLVEQRDTEEQLPVFELHRTFEHFLQDRDLVPFDRENCEELFTKILCASAVLPKTEHLIDDSVAPSSTSMTTASSHATSEAELRQLIANVWWERVARLKYDPHLMKITS